MNIRSGFSSLLSAVLVSSIVCQGLPALAQRRVSDRLAGKIGNSSSFVVRGNVHPLATARNDRGRMPATFRMQHITMLFKSTDRQQTELDALLEQQQDSHSANYHRWLSPQEFGARFGLSENDMNKVVDWLQQQGFHVDEIAPGGRSVTFS